MFFKNPQEKKCGLYIMLFPYGGVSTSYDAANGLKHSMTLVGRIDDAYPISVFHGKTARLKVCAPPDLAWLEEIRTSLGDKNACGGASVSAGVEPPRVELDGEEIDIEPVEIRLDVSTDAFEAIRRQAASADNHHRIMRSEIVLSGAALPETESHFMFLEDLDVSKAQEYAVASFEIVDTRCFDHMRGRVLQKERSRDKGYGTGISVLLTETRYDIYPERASVHEISCQGRVTNRFKGKPYYGVDVTIEFREFEPKLLEELPKQAFFGKFYYYPRQSDEEHSAGHLSFELYYVPGDARDLLIPVLSQKEVVISINLTKEEDELANATDELEGDVRYYIFKVQQYTIDNAQSSI